jgi:hypothetical protein
MNMQLLNVRAWRSQASCMHAVKKGEEAKSGLMHACSEMHNCTLKH